jgi:hypothetical protein
MAVLLCRELLRLIAYIDPMKAPVFDGLGRLSGRGDEEGI